jgi:hypothetical protein
MALFRKGGHASHVGRGDGRSDSSVSVKVPSESEADATREDSPSGCHKLKKPIFADLGKVDQHLANRSYCKMASYNVHATRKGIFFGGWRRPGSARRSSHPRYQMLPS